MTKCVCCGKSIEVNNGEIADRCCSDYCWETYYAPGPQEEAELEYDRIELAL